MKLNEIKHGPKDPIGMVLIRQLMARGVPVFYQDMEEIRMIKFTDMPGTDLRDEIAIIYGDGKRNSTEYLSVEQFEAMDLRRVEGSEIEEWQLV
jgi:hypothetical protein